MKHAQLADLLRRPELSYEALREIDLSRPLLPVDVMETAEIEIKYEGYIHGAGMVLLLALMAFVMFKDIFVIFKR